MSGTTIGTLSLDTAGSRVVLTRRLRGSVDRSGARARGTSRDRLGPEAERRSLAGVRLWDGRGGVGVETRGSDGSWDEVFGDLSDGGNVAKGGRGAR